eukprot:TRINITY_DN13000_c0_g1_i2.p1 TRINITY_DN13000_c0_g1~~TRINITY_DN13000_c0_g1_i2.p1  ORF type:complete len:947 (-),score=422.19 TRINITY_DN13000_c0_g1_i2:75-2915(-)
MPANSVIMGLDLVPIKPMPGVKTFTQDITSQSCRSLIKREIHGYSADAILHDGAPNMGAAWVHDAYSQSELVLHSLKLATEFLKRGGLFVTKVFRSGDYNKLMWIIEKFFEKVSVSKPPSSRLVSAEVFLVCENFLAPEKVDPRLLDPKHVFKDVEQGHQQEDVLRKGEKHKQRQRQGYDASLGQTLRRTMSVFDFINEEEPGKTLDGMNEIYFDEMSKAFEEHDKTTDEIKELLKDLLVCGKAEYREVVKWHKQMQKVMKTLQPESSESEEEEEDSETDVEQLSPQEREARDEALLDENLQKLRTADKKKADKVKKKNREKKKKVFERLQAGVDNTLTTTIVDEEHDLFQIKHIKDDGHLDRIIKGDGIPIVSRDAINQDDHIYIPEEDPLGPTHFIADIGDKTAYAADMAAAIDNDYKQHMLDRKVDDLNDFTEKKGKKLTRRQRVNLQEMQKEQEYQKFVDEQRDAYAKKLKEVRQDVGEGIDDVEVEGSDESDSSDDNESANPLMIREEDILDNKDEQLAAASNRWFSSKLFNDTGLEEEEEALLNEDNKNNKNKSNNNKKESNKEQDMEIDDDADAESDDDWETDSEDEAPMVRVGVIHKANESIPFEERDVVGMLDGVNLPKSERQKAKDRKMKRNIREEKRKARQHDDEELEIVAAGGGDVDLDASSENEDDSESEVDDETLERRKQISAGFGEVESDEPALKKAKGNDGSAFEVVPKQRDFSDSSDSESSDSEETDDDETRAVHMALGAQMMKKHRKRDLIDASYNRYAWDDGDEMPDWFKDDERKHSQPMLPITKEEADIQRQRFHELNAKPMNKVLEARARKRNRETRARERAKRQADSIAKNSDLNTGQKMKAMARVLNAPKREQRSKVYVVGQKTQSRKNNGRGTQGVKAGKNSRVKMVDSRMKSDRAAEKRKERGGRTSGGKRRKGKKGSRRN